MRCQLFIRLLFVALFALCVVLPARAQQPQPEQQPEEGITTRGAFLTTRPKTANTQSKKTSGEAAVVITTPTKKSEPSTIASNMPRPAKKSSAKSSGNTKPKKKTGKGATANDKVEMASGEVKNSGVETIVLANAATATNPHPIGLGYTLFSLGDNGEAVRTNPTRQFRTGEAIRVSLETNTDGYLYIFHTENDGEPTMIFPDARLNRGSNLVSAHVPYEIPSSQEASEAMRWFVFKDPPADERLYIIVTREPLVGVPTGQELADFCFNKKNTCPWRPATAMWTDLKMAREREQVAVSHVKDEGRAQTSDEREATTRGLGLGTGAPSPSVIRMTASAGSKMLVTAIDLVHK